MGFKRERRKPDAPLQATEPCFTREEVMRRSDVRAVYVRLKDTYGSEVAERYIDVMRSPVSKGGGAMTEYPSELKRGVEV